nr:hypothetical protein HAGR004_12060 [Bdellovibrio sp. HAGR004]
MICFETTTLLHRKFRISVKTPFYLGEYTPHVDWIYYMTRKKNQRKTKSVLEMTHTEAADFFLKGESYCAVDLPNYFSFESLLQNVKEKMNGKTFNELNAGKPIDHDDVNYTLLGNKDGKFSWRPFELINPILYTSLVNLITNEKNWKLLLQLFRFT